MKLSLESTGEILKLTRGPYSAAVRVWTGTTADGVPIKAYIAAVEPQTHDPEVEAAFARELDELSQVAPVKGIELRFIL